MRAAPVIRRLRLASGLTLFAYVSTHLLNHAFGLISLDTLETARLVFLAVWRFPPVTVLLDAALVVHFLLALFAIFWRHRLMLLRPAEALQLVLGLAIIPLMAEHVLGTRALHDTYGLNDTYTYVVAVLWVFAPEKAPVQMGALLVAWIHGCLGVYFYLRLKPWYPRWQPYLYAAALLIPTLAIIGFVDTGRQVAFLAQSNPDWMSRAMASWNLPPPSALEEMEGYRHLIWLGVGLSVAAVLAARQVRIWLERVRGRIAITYPGGRRIDISPGMTVLEVSQLNGIPHASVCGGRGRCSTCRIRVTAGADGLPLPSATEESVLKRVAAPPGTRLACQTRPTASLSVVPLLPATATAREGHQRPAYAQGSEREIAILFADLRGFTQLSERKLPFDVVFMLNRYFTAMGHAIERTGGHVDKFIGDGVMALFGIDSDARTGCRQALSAARAMGENLQELNRTLAHELDRPLRIGIGIHVGPAIVGEMGHARATSVTAIGDAVNTASRLEQLTKDFAAQLVVSEEVAQRAQIDLSAFPLHETAIRGRAGALSVRTIADALALPEGTGG